MYVQQRLLRCKLQFGQTAGTCKRLVSRRHSAQRCISWALKEIPRLIFVVLVIISIGSILTHWDAGTVSLVSDLGRGTLKSEKNNIYK